MARQLVDRHTLERRSDMMAAAIKNRVDTIAHGITPPGGRPPFTRRMTVREALAWWLKHRYDPIGMQMFAGMMPVQQQELDAWLAEAVNHPAAAGATPQGQPVRLPDPGSVLVPAQIAERRMEGAPIGSEVA
jgi:hypothetical protein